MGPHELIGWVIVVSAAALGAVGIARLYMTAMGLRLLQSCENKLHIKLPTIEVGVNTPHLGVVIILLEFLLVVAYIQLHHSDADAATPFTPPLPRGGYTVYEETVEVDLRKRKDVSMGAYLKGQVSETTRSVHKIIERIDDGVQQMNFYHATSGPGIVVEEKPDEAEWRMLVSDGSTEMLYNPFVTLLTGKFFNDLKARRGRMKSYFMTVPTESYGSGQQLAYTLEYQNAFQGRHFEWAGKVFDADTENFRVRIVFPETKPFTSVEVYKKEPGQCKAAVTTDTVLTKSEDGLAINWSIRGAKRGEQYYLKWFW